MVILAGLEAIWSDLGASWVELGAIWSPKRDPTGIENETNMTSIFRSIFELILGRIWAPNLTRSELAQLRVSSGAECAGPG